MSNLGDLGNLGDVGNLGDFTRFSGGIASPDRVELPFIAERARDPNGAETDLRVQDLRVALEAWPERSWAGQWRAWLVLAEFSDTRVTGWQERIRLPDWRGYDSNAELITLANLAEDERPDALGEIVAQDALYANFMKDFVALLGMSASSHGATSTLMHVGGLVGTLVSMRLKRQPAPGVPARPRPSQLMPALYPPIEMPGHPAYPSGHATQSTLMALGVTAAMPAAREKAVGHLLHTLAGRIARNREIAGLHYASDSVAGHDAARQTFAILQELPSYAALLDTARAEWA